MKKVLIIIIILVLFIPFYVMCANYIAYKRLYVLQTEKNITAVSGTHVEVDMNDLVSVSIQRNRWYGTIYGQYGTNVSIENLYFFNVIKIPINVNGTSWGLYHMIVIGSIIFLIVDVLFIDFMLKLQKLIHKNRDIIKS